MADQGNDVHVCFVCSGNICRSPMAALIFREELRRAGLDGVARVSSAGLGPWHAGEPADPRASRTLAAAGYPTDHVATQVGPEHIGADLLVAMDSGHEDALLRMVDDPNRVRMLRSFDPTAKGEDQDIPDPYFGGRKGFTELLAMLQAAMPGLLDWVRTG
ncbi:MAG: low molecular weight protein-tyrosine-phosphatase [Sciscionella sp.]